MTLFTDDEHRDLRSRRSPVRVVGWISLAIAGAVIGIFAVAPSPYVIEQPGPVYNTLGAAQGADGSEIPLITIPDETTYPTEGSLDLLTVSVVGNPDRRPNWIEVGTAWLDSSKAVVPIEAVFPGELTNEQREQQNQAAMIDSQQDAIAAALVELGYEFPREVTVRGLLEDSPSEGALEVDDVITTVNAEPVHDITALREAIQANGADAPATLGVRRDGAEIEVDVTPVDRDGILVIGVGVGVAYEFPIDVEIQLDNVGGPSAGMMFALGIIDKLTPGALNGGEHIAGTGTIDSGGNVGPIGGIRQKMHGALGAGADWFLAPELNCSEVAGAIPSGLSVFAVETLDDAMTVIETIADGGNTASLPSCPAG